MEDYKNKHNNKINLNEKNSGTENSSKDPYWG